MQKSEVATKGRALRRAIALINGSFEHVFLFDLRVDLVHAGEVWVGRSSELMASAWVADKVLYFASQEEAEAQREHQLRGLTGRERRAYETALLRDPLTTPHGLPPYGWRVTHNVLAIEAEPAWVPVRTRREAVSAFCAAYERKHGLDVGSCHFFRARGGDLRFWSPFSRGEDGASSANVEPVGDVGAQPTAEVA